MGLLNETATTNVSMGSKVNKFILLPGHILYGVAIGVKNVIQGSEFDKCPDNTKT